MYGCELLPWLQGLPLHATALSCGLMSLTCCARARVYVCVCLAQVTALSANLYAFCPAHNFMCLYVFFVWVCVRAHVCSVQVTAPCANLCSLHCANSCPSALRAKSTNLHSAVSTQMCVCTRSAQVTALSANLCTYCPVCNLLCLCSAQVTALSAICVLTALRTNLSFFHARKCMCARRRSPP